MGGSDGRGTIFLVENLPPPASGRVDVGQADRPGGLRFEALSETIGGLAPTLAPEPGTPDGVHESTRGKEHR